MAFVGISSNLLSRVTNKIHKMEQAELKTLGEEPKVSLPPDNPNILRALWGEHLHLKNLIPSQWKSNISNMRASVRIPLEGGESKTYGYNISFTSETEAPMTHGYYQVYNLEINVPELAEIHEYAAKHTDIARRWAKVSDKIAEYLKSCKSLNEAVKTWPDVKLYIDQEDLDRLEVKREKQVKSTAATEALAEMNVDELVGAVVIARMSGAA